MSEELEALRIAAEHGDADAAWNLAKCYALGDGVEQDVDKLIEWAGIAALNGNEEAAGWLLNGYDKGSDDGFIQPDKAKLLEWADKLSAAGNNVGRVYYAELYTNLRLKHSTEHSGFFVLAKLSAARRTGCTRERNEAKPGRKRHCANDMV